jgi:NADH-quinone oxidoreductase subunit E
VPLEPTTRSAIASLVEAYPERRSALLPALKLAQAESGWLTSEAVKEAADLVGVPHAAAFELATFYTMLHYTTEPNPPAPPQRVVVCAQLPCALRGADRLLRDLRAGLQHELANGSVEIERTSECFGACHRAPMARVNDAYRENLTPEATQQLLSELREQPARAAAANGSADGQGAPRRRIRPRASRA